MKATTNPRHKVTFAGYSDAQCVALAMLGQSTRTIQRETKLTPSQIQYRLTKAKNVEGNKNGYRVAWRNGDSPVVQKIKNDMLSVIRRDVQARIPQRLEHQPAKMKKI